MVVLVKDFVFEMRDRPDTQIEMGMGLLPRPRVVGEDGTDLPLRVSRNSPPRYDKAEAHAPFHVHPDVTR